MESLECHKKKKINYVGILKSKIKVLLCRRKYLYLKKWTDETGC